MTAFARAGPGWRQSARSERHQPVVQSSPEVASAVPVSSSPLYSHVKRLKSQVHNKLYFHSTSTCALALRYSIGACPERL